MAFIDRRNGVCNGVEHLGLTRLAAGNVVVGRELEVAAQRDTQADVDTQVRLLELESVLVATHAGPRKLLIAHIEPELRAGKEEDVGQRTQSHAIAQVDGNVDFLLFHRGLTSDSIRVLHLGRTLVVEGRSVEAKANDGQCELNRGTNKPAGTVVAVEHVLAETHLGHVETALETELDLGVGRPGHHQRHGQKEEG